MTTGLNKQTPQFSSKTCPLAKLEEGLGRAVLAVEYKGNVEGANEDTSIGELRLVVINKTQWQKQPLFFGVMKLVLNGLFDDARQLRSPLEPHCSRLGWISMYPFWLGISIFLGASLDKGLWVNM